MNTMKKTPASILVMGCMAMAILVSGCPELLYVTVPNVTGSTQATAEAEILAAGLTIGAVTEQYSDTVPEGRVISQNPAGGSSVVLGSPVSLRISIGPEPSGQEEYDAGFADGFAEDDEYWQGYDDSYDTVNGGTIYYSGGEIPYIEELTYEAGYWDGVWQAYNDGYFVAYDYAFTIGFSEGYDVGYSILWPVFFAGDTHPEYLDGGFSDGYNDGFTEGSVFGAYDYENGIPYDWLGAMMDYRSPIDLCVDDYCTGEYGPVTLYEYGTDPNDLVKKSTPRTPRASMHAPFAIRKSDSAKADTPAISYRALIQSVKNELSIKPAKSPRSDRTISLTTTWLQRVEDYRDQLNK
ncbi:MAG TPA: PASTA domain-containing protein [Candidatus Hydrogenedentes bacterium]|nr:PASTA domain-containing protein [Candidatus Hydrogenedentota bacterium]